MHQNNPAVQLTATCVAACTLNDNIRKKKQVKSPDPNQSPRHCDGWREKIHLTRMVCGTEQLAGFRFFTKTL